MARRPAATRRRCARTSPSRLLMASPTSHNFKPRRMVLAFPKAAGHEQEHFLPDSRPEAWARLEPAFWAFPVWLLPSLRGRHRHRVHSNLRPQDWNHLMKPLRAALRSCPDYVLGLCRNGAPLPRCRARRLRSVQHSSAVPGIPRVSHENAAQRSLASQASDRTGRAPRPNQPSPATAKEKTTFI